MGLATYINNNVALPEPQQQLIEKAAQKNGLKDFEIETNVNSNKGDNFIGQIIKVNVKDKDSDRVVCLILKSFREQNIFPTTPLFIRESLMYNDILPQLLKYQSDANITNPFTGVARCYGSYLENGSEAILMEDLMVRGFRMWNKRYPMEDDHVSLVLSQYAKLHAISLAIGKKHPEKFEEWKLQLTDVWGNDKEKEDNPIFTNLLFRAKANGMDSVKDETLKQRLDDTWDSVLVALKMGEEEELTVVTHGDSWCNNMMFAYDGSMVKQVCLIDWQLSKVGTPLWDLVYFFHVCASKAVLYDYKKYLALYHKTLSENLKEFGCDVNDIISYETFLEKWDKFASVGLFCVLMLGKVMMSDSDDIPDDLNDQIGEEFTKSFHDVINFDSEKQTAYEQRISDVVQFMLDNRFLKDFKLSDITQN